MVIICNSATPELHDANRIVHVIELLHLMVMRNQTRHPEHFGLAIFLPKSERLDQYRGRPYRQIYLPYVEDTR